MLQYYYKEVIEMPHKKAIKVLPKRKEKTNVQQFTQVQNLGGNKLSVEDFRLLNKMSHASKALDNITMYTRKFFCRNRKRGACSSSGCNYAG
jgi:hypothetical protein